MMNKTPDETILKEWAAIATLCEILEMRHPNLGFAFLDKSKATPDDLYVLELYTELNDRAFDIDREYDMPEPE